MKKLFSSLFLGAFVVNMPTVQATSMSDLQKQVDELKQEVNTLKHENVSSGGDTDWLSRDFVTSGDVPVHVTLSGQLNRAVLFADDGDNSDYSSVDNDASSTRFAINANAALNDHLTIGGTWETEFESNSTRAINQFDRENAGNLSARKLEVFFDSDLYGKLSLGQGRTASDQTSENSFSGTKNVSYASMPMKMAGGFFFRDTSVDQNQFKTDVSNSTGAQISRVFTSMDGLGLDDRVRYDSLAYKGLSFSTSVQQRGLWDAALNYSCSCEDMSLKGSIAYSDPGDRSVDYNFNGSLAGLHKATGLNAAFTAAKTKRSSTATQNKDGHYYYAQLGLKKMLNEYGSTNFAVDYARSKDMISDGGKGRSFGVGVVQHIDMISGEVYLGWRKYTYDDSAKTYDNLTAAILGARVKF